MNADERRCLHATVVRIASSRSVVTLPVGFWRAIGLPLDCRDRVNGLEAQSQAASVFRRAFGTERG